jgi:hypothetical protein
MEQPARLCYDSQCMIRNPHSWARAWGGAKRAPNPLLPCLQGEAFVRGLELVTAFLQGNDVAVTRMLSETNDEDCCEIMYALLACAYAIDEAVREEHAGA